jgi:hypothetical protein
VHNRYVFPLPTKLRVAWDEIEPLIEKLWETLFLENGFVGSEYVEVYAGGASVALSLLFGEYASRVTSTTCCPALDRPGRR